MICFARSNRGVTLIELMIAMVLGLLVSAALGSIFIMSSRGYTQDQRLLELQDQARIALDQMVNDIEMAGYWGTVFVPANLSKDSLPAVTGDCSEFFFNSGTSAAPLDLEVAVETSNYDETVFPCISNTGDAVVSGTQVIGINRVEGSDREISSAADLVDNYIYLNTKAGDGTLFMAPGTATYCDSTNEQSCWKYSPAIYFLSANSSCSNTTADGSSPDGVPTLCRKLYLNGSDGTTVNSGSDENKYNQAIGPGVENMVIEYGLDTDGDGYADTYTTFDSIPANATDEATRLSELKQVASVRVYLLVRSEDPVPGYTNSKSYQLGPVTIAAKNDRYYRKVLSATAGTRNIVTHAQFQ